MKRFTIFHRELGFFIGSNLEGLAQWSATATACVPIVTFDSHTAAAKFIGLFSIQPQQRRSFNVVMVEAPSSEFIIYRSAITYVFFPALVRAGYGKYFEPMLQHASAPSSAVH